MYQLVRPQIAIPVHGEARHITEHAALAKECQVPQALVAENGDVIRLAPGPAEIVAEVPSGRLGLDGKAWSGWRRRAAAAPPDELQRPHHGLGRADKTAS